MSQASAYERVPVLVAYRDGATVRDTYGGTGEHVVLEAHLLRPPTPSPTVVVMMHPIGGLAYLPLPIALARAGVHVLCCNSRYRGVDSALIMERVVQDLGACVRRATDDLGYERVVLGGWSGGGALSMYYQQQAERPSVRATPAGDPPDLTAADLRPADAVMLLAAHVSRHRTLTEWIDPSIVDERDPTVRDVELDLYDPRNPHQPPYAAEYVERFRAAQIERNRRITRWVEATLDTLRAAGHEHEDRAFVVHNTMAEPRWLDPAVDPNDRSPGTCYLGDPKEVNTSPIGLARFTTLRSWLSQWSYDRARGDAIGAARDVTCPVLVIGNTADDACTPSHTRRLYDAVAHLDRELHEIAGATHYYAGADQRAPLARAVAVITDWLARHDLGDGEAGGEAVEGAGS